MQLKKEKKDQPYMQTSFAICQRKEEYKRETAAQAVGLVPKFAPYMKTVVNILRVNNQN